MLKMFRKSLNNRKGFTLVELLVVVAIIGVLAAIAIPKFASATEAANGAKMMADLRTIDSAISIAIAKNETVAAAAVTTAANPKVAGYLSAIPVSPGTDKKFTGPKHAASTAVPAAGYVIIGDGTAGDPYRAACDTLKAEDI